MFRICLLLCFFVPLTIWAQARLEISDTTTYIPISSYLSIAEDPSKKLELNDAFNFRYTALDMAVPNFGFKNTSFWLKGSIINVTNKDINTTLEIANPNLDLIEVFLITKGSITYYKKTGDLFPFNHRKNRNKYFQFRLPLDSKEITTIYINVQNSGEHFHVPISIGKADYYKEKENKEQLLFGIYFGILLFVLLFNFFFYRVLKVKSSIYYIGFIASLLLAQLSLTGIGFCYFWGNSVFLANHANPMFGSLSLFFLLLFSKSFLNIKQYLPKFNNFYTVLEILTIIVFICAIIPNASAYHFAVVAVNVLIFSLSIIIIPTAFYILKKKFKPARFFIFAFIVLFVTALVFVIKNLGWLPSNNLTNYGLQIGSALECILLTLAVIDRFNQFRIEAFNRLQEINELKTEATIELEKKVEERTLEISAQKLLLEHKNEEILSSIRYAKRIQEAILPPDELLDKLFNGNCFVYYNPKDIVSGDFYYAALANAGKERPTALSVAAVVDCTGHGVPGAFMSIVGNNFLKQASVEPTVNSPAEALDFLNKNIITSLNQISSSTFAVRDGMDIALIAIDYVKKRLHYAGANNPLYIIRNNELQIINADKQAIGSVGVEIKNYTNHIFQLEEGDCIYLFSDGYADQFGGPDAKKFTYKRFRELLLKASLLPIKEQGTLLKSSFEAWKGNQEQLDDVCIMGIKI